MTTESHQCEATYWVGWGKTRCAVKGRTERNGKWYCKRHDPVAVKAKAQASQAAYDVEWAARRRTDRRAERVAKVNAAKAKIYDDYRAAMQTLRKAKPKSGGTFAPNHVT